MLPRMGTYDLTAVDLPKLDGARLRWFARALTMPGLGPAALDKLARDAGVDVLQKAGLTEAPRPLPLYPARLADPSRTSPAVDLRALPDVDAEGPFVSAAALVAAYRAGTTDPLQVAERLLEADTGTTFIAQDKADVRHQAEAAKLRYASGAPRGPLDGVPVAVKDELDLVPYPTTVGTAFLGERPARADATVCARLRAAGAVLIGKANMHEIGINPNGANPHHGFVANPYDPRRDTGGSSSGSAAAVAAGLCPIAIGADGGGSVRIPAALCGAVGLKATYGRISEHGAAPLCWSVAHVGPIGASVADVALAYALIAGPDAEDPNSLVQPDPTLDGLEAADLSGVRVGVYPAWFEHATPALVEAAAAAVARLEAAGAERVEVEIPDLDLVRIAHAITILTEMQTAMERFGERWAELAPHVQVNLSVADRFGASDYIRAQQARARAMANLDRCFERVDVLVTPTTAIPAPPIPVSDPHETWSDLSTVTELMRFAFLTNFTGHPALTVPSGYHEGLPLGVQLTGRHWDEATLLRLGRVVEAGVDRRCPPGYLRLV